MVHRGTGGVLRRERPERLRFYKFVNVSPKSILALSEPVPWRPAFKTLLAMATVPCCRPRTDFMEPRLDHGIHVDNVDVFPQVSVAIAETSPYFFGIFLKRIWNANFHHILFVCKSRLLSRPLQ
jgi:hypothetical protein